MGTAHDDTRAIEVEALTIEALGGPRVVKARTNAELPPRRAAAVRPLPAVPASADRASVLNKLSTLARTRPPQARQAAGTTNPTDRSGRARRCARRRYLGSWEKAAVASPAEPRAGRTAPLRGLDTDLGSRQWKTSWFASVRHPQLMRVFRLWHPDWDGKGGLLASGRWHHRGTAIVYTSSTLSSPGRLFVNSTRVPCRRLLRARGDVPIPSRSAVDPATLPRMAFYPAPRFGGGAGGTTCSTPASSSAASRPGARALRDRPANAEALSHPRGSWPFMPPRGSRQSRRSTPTWALGLWRLAFAFIRGATMTACAQPIACGSASSSARVWLQRRRQLGRSWPVPGTFCGRSSHRSRG
jgi:hypothetical protein